MNETSTMPGVLLEWGSLRALLVWWCSWVTCGWNQKYYYLIQYSWPGSSKFWSSLKTFVPLTNQDRETNRYIFLIESKVGIDRQTFHWTRWSWTCWISQIEIRLTCWRYDKDENQSIRGSHILHKYLSKFTAELGDAKWRFGRRGLLLNVLTKFF